ncbi:MAG: LysR family transcriptional regulator [Gallionella sp.]|jgi:DNA-binding transcriptional LysR family regulator|nr:LysR family transcriptional regulator [Gallionella sp.]
MAERSRLNGYDMNSRQRIHSFLRKRLNTRQILFIAELEMARSLGGAAQAVGMSQPAASTLVKGFEDALGVQLFERHARGIVPTPYGEILTRHARAVIAELDQAQEEIAALKSGLTGQASIGAVATPGTNLIPCAVAQLKQQHPRLLISIEIDNSLLLIDKLLRGQLDLVVGRLLNAQGAGELQLEPLSGEVHAAIAAAHHPLAGIPTVDLADLVTQLWILPPPGSLLRERLTAVFQQRDLPMPLNVVEAQSIPAILGLLHAAQAIVPLPRELVQSLCDCGDLAVLIEDIGLDLGPFGLITRRQHRLSPGAQALATVLRTTAATLYSRSTSDSEPLAPSPR